MTTRATVEDGLEWVTALFERVSKEPELLGACPSAQERAAVMLILQAILQQIQRELQHDSMQRVTLGSRPFRRESFSSISITATAAASFAQTMGAFAIARIFGASVTLGLPTGWVKDFSAMAANTATKVEAVDPGTVPANVAIALDLNGRSVVLEHVGARVLWLPDGLLPQKIADIRDVASVVNYIVSPQLHRAAIEKELSPRGGDSETVARWPWVGCEDNKALYEKSRELGEIEFLAGFAEDPQLIESMGCRCAADLVLINRSLQSVYGGYSWLRWNTPRALQLLAPRVMIVREKTEVDGVGFALSPGRVREWARGVMHWLVNGSDDEDLW